MKLINKNEFNAYLNNFYKNNSRDLLWRKDYNFYYVLVSEFMLQQTQVSRVINYFDRFIKKLPSLEDLAQADQITVLSLWSGLGYNRRALYLHHAAKTIYKEYYGKLPQDYNLLLKIKGIGEYTAKALVTYTYNIPLIFVETNIRSVFFIYYKNLFIEKKDIDDTIIKKIIIETIDNENPREWYYALMDLGSHFKKIYKDKHIQKSKFFTHQSTFKGSKREIRGNIIKILIEKKIILKNELINICNDSRTQECLILLEKEGFLLIEDKKVILK